MIFVVNVFISVVYFFQEEIFISFRDRHFVYELNQDYRRYDRVLNTILNIKFSVVVLY